MNPVELISDIFKAYSKADESSLHVGEVMNLWTMLTATENFTNSEEITLSKVEDKDLREKMSELIENYHKPAIEQIKQILLKEGVELPQEPTKKPNIEINVPPGAKMTDEEVANFVVFNIVWAIKFCARGLTESVRADVGAFFTKLIIEKATFAMTLKQVMADKGWLKIPPLHKVPGMK